ncbi:MAG: thermonuclease family protein [Verrucomicrobiae bacterium]|nr:thermonuclease family protein [Verrucomicrobiae bacterium]
MIDSRVHYRAKSVAQGAGPFWRKCAIFGLLVCLASARQISAEIIEGRVIGIHDGDSLTLLTQSQKKHRIRLAEIDAPEEGQKFAELSTKALAGKVFGKWITVKSKVRDQYSRIIGTVLLEGENVNLWMVKQGFAWHYAAYSEDSDFANAEILARKAKRGIWVNAPPMPPWEFRKRMKQN